MIIWCMLTQIWSKTDIIFCHFRPFFVLLPHYWHRKLNFGKNVKNTRRYYPFTHVYHKSRSYDVWFLRYKVQRTEFLSFWAIFCPFTSLPTLPDLEISFYTCVPKIMISWCTVPEIWWATDGRKRWHKEVTFKKAKGVLV